MAMSEFILGLLVAVCGALLLASGTELQSRAVDRGRGRWQIFLRSRQWICGLLLLAIAVCTNFVALALTPVSVVQSVSVIALTASAAVGVLTRRVIITRGTVMSIALCAIGVLGFIPTMAAHVQQHQGADLDPQLRGVSVILSLLVVLGLGVMVSGRRLSTRNAKLVSLMVSAMMFGSITTVFKVLVLKTMERGLGETLTEPRAQVAVGIVALAGFVASVLLQRSHRAFPAPVVVASLTIVDPLTAALIGIGILGEVVLTPAAAIVLLIFGATATAGVIGLGRLRRRELSSSVTPDDLAPVLVLSGPSERSH